MEIIMRIRCLRSFLAAAAVCMLFDCTPISAWEGVKNINWLTDTPKENVFRVEGDKREFILLDITDDPKSKFFVLAKEYYDDRAFNSAAKCFFDPTDGKNLGGWLNGSFIKYGNQVNSGEVMKFPKGIVDHIDMKHVWITDGKEAETEALGTYGVGLMSQEEMVRYVDKFGVDDGLTTSILFTNTYGWWLRSQDVNDTLSKVVFRYDQQNGTNIHTWNVKTDGIAVRPCFYLDEDFFSEVRVSLTDLGDNVKAAFKQVYLKSELSEAYTNEELWDVFGFRADVNLEITGWSDGAGNEISNLKDADYTEAAVRIKSRLREDTDAGLLMVLYGEDNCPITFAVKPIETSYEQELTCKIGMPLSKVKREDGCYIKIYLIRAGTRLKAISNAVRIYL